MRKHILKESYISKHFNVGLHICHVSVGGVEERHSKDINADNARVDLEQWNKKNGSIKWKGVQQVGAKHQTL
eukprot:776433-Ditylum_brightwellii.AAC.1